MKHVQSETHCRLCIRSAVGLLRLWQTFTHPVYASTQQTVALGPMPNSANVFKPSLSSSRTRLSIKSRTSLSTKVWSSNGNAACANNSDLKCERIVQLASRRRRSETSLSQRKCRLHIFESHELQKRCNPCRPHTEFRLELET